MRSGDEGSRPPVRPADLAACEAVLARADAQIARQGGALHQPQPLLLWLIGDLKINAGRSSLNTPSCFDRQLLRRKGRRFHQS